MQVCDQLVIFGDVDYVVIVAVRLLFLYLVDMVSSHQVLHQYFLLIFRSLVDLRLIFFRLVCFQRMLALLIW